MGKDSLSLFDSFLFPHLFRAFRMSVHPRRLLVAFLAVLLLVVAGRLMDLARPVKGEASGVNELTEYLDNPGRVETFIDQARGTESRIGLFSTLFHFEAAQFHQALYALMRFDLAGLLVSIGQTFKVMQWALIYHGPYVASYFVLGLVVMAVFGGAICRMAALQFAKGERPGMVDSLRFSYHKFPGLVAAWVIPLTVMVLLGLLISGLGLIGNIPWVGELLVGLGMPLVLIAGAVIVVLLLGILAGADLMWPTIAYEDGDSFTAINYAYRFVFARPWHLGFYKALAFVYGAVTYGFVRFFAFLLLLLCYRFLQLGFLYGNVKLYCLWQEPSFLGLVTGSPLTEGRWTLVIGSHLIQGAAWVIVGLLIAFMMSFYFTINTILYALLRKWVDRVELDHMPGHPDPSCRVAPSPSTETPATSACPSDDFTVPYRADTCPPRPLK